MSEKNTLPSHVPTLNRWLTRLASSLGSQAFRSYNSVMEPNLRPETESRVQELAAKTGRAADDLVEGATLGYLQEIVQTRDMLDSRYDDLKAGRVKGIDSEEAFLSLRRKGQQRRSSANSFS